MRRAYTGYRSTPRSYMSRHAPRTQHNLYSVRCVLGVQGAPGFESRAQRSAMTLWPSRLIVLACARYRHVTSQPGA
eukprot:10963169-Alexandrium_andersonii.AAC.1